MKTAKIASAGFKPACFSAAVVGGALFLAISGTGAFAAGNSAVPVVLGDDGFVPPPVNDTPAHRDSMVRSPSERVADPVETLADISSNSDMNDPQDSAMQMVAMRGEAYDAGRHGPRYHSRRSGYVYYHRGYYYRQPWWLRAGGRAVTGTIRATNQLLSPHR